MFEAAVDGFGRAVAGVGVVEVGQDVPGSAFERPTQRMSSVRPLGTRVEVRAVSGSGQGHTLAPRYARGGQSVDFRLHQGLTPDFVGITVGVDDVLVDAPGDFECDVAIAGEQVG